MRVTINGKPERLPEAMTVARLLDGLKLPPIRVAVEVNEDLVPRRQFAETTLKNGDRIEIVTFVGGG